MTKEIPVHPVFIYINIDLSKINEELNTLKGALAEQKYATGYTELVFFTAYASMIENIYSGIEKIFTRICSKIDKDVPTGDSWHADLLDVMAVEIPAVRPAVISNETLNALHELRRFRHRQSNLYSGNIVFEKLDPNIQRTINIVPIIEEEISKFSENLVNYLDDSEIPGIRR